MANDARRLGEGGAGTPNTVVALIWEVALQISWRLVVRAEVKSEVERIAHLTWSRLSEAP
jgi:hypothetical protein